MKHTALARVFVLFAGVVLLTSGCANIDEDPALGMASMPGEADSTACVLSYVNSPAVTLRVLDDEVGLRRDAATNLIVHRDGSDRASRTIDDNLFDTLAEIQTVDQIGAAALSRLESAANAWCAAVPERAWESTVHGVAFTVEQTDIALTLINTMSKGQLVDLFDETEIDVVEEIVERREIMSLDMLAEIPGVSRREVGALRSAALRW